MVDLRSVSFDPIRDRDFLGGSAFAAARALIRLGYFSFEVEGLEHVPRQGPVVLAQNHSGWFPLDAFAVMLAVHEAQGLDRVPFYATHESALATPFLGPWLRRFGALPASWFLRPDRMPRQIQVCGIFPEGVEGNCKPFWEAYRMRPWNRGFVRVAASWGAPVVPVAILGGEECLPVAWTVRALEPLIGSVVGLPLSPIPLPARWKVVFHEPVRLELSPGPPGQAAQGNEIARRVQSVVQQTLDREAAGRALGRLSSFVAARRPAPPLSDEDPLAEPEPPPTQTKPAAAHETAAPHETPAAPGEPPRGEAEPWRPPSSSTRTPFRSPTTTPGIASSPARGSPPAPSRGPRSSR